MIGPSSDHRDFFRSHGGGRRGARVRERALPQAVEESPHKDVPVERDGDGTGSGGEVEHGEFEIVENVRSVIHPKDVKEARKGVGRLGETEIVAVRLRQGALKLGTERVRRRCRRCCRW